MFNIFKRNKRDNIKKEEIIKKEKNFVNVSFKNNMTTIEILEDCTLEELNEATKNIDIDKLKIPVRMYIKNDNNLSKQSIAVFECDNNMYIFVNDNDELKLSQRKFLDNRIEETVIYIDKFKEKYKITKYEHDLNYSTKSTKWYPLNNDKMGMFSLDKVEAIAAAYKLLDDIKEDEVDDFINIEKIYRHLNLVEGYRYYPVIKDEIMTLSWPCRFSETNINKKKNEFFDIILNETKEAVGTISFNYQTASGFTYGGNVSYYIKPEFRGNHYATRALGLLKKLLVKNMFEGDKDLYIATTPENYKSQKVILNNEGELFYKGDVPKNDSINCIDGIKKVNVYKIKIK